MRRLLTALCACAAVCLAAAPSAFAKPHRGPCLSSDPNTPTCLIWTGKVDFIADGDTVDVDIDGDGTKRAFRVRLTGYNAPELTHYSRRASERRGTCQGVSAANQIERMIRQSHGRVRLKAQRASSRSGGRRLRRMVEVKIGGHWRDVGAPILRAGHALWLQNPVESAWNREYSTIAQEAMARGVGLWSKTSCGAGPEAGAQLDVRVKWDADGNDAQNINGEWVEIKNLDPNRPVAIGGWRVRVSDLRHFVLPAGTEVPAGGRIRVRMGHGTSDGSNFYWGFGHAVFGPQGDAAYLFDPEGDPRAWMIYPCRFACGDPLEGVFRVGAQYQGRQEYVTLRNTSGAAADLNGYILWLPYHQYEFGANSVVQPGETMRVDIGGDPADDTRLRRYYGFNGPMLTDSGQRVQLRAYHDAVVGCTAWGNFSC
jgi:endonuclease YncB( thermonuclease family)